MRVRFIAVFISILLALQAAAQEQVELSPEAAASHLLKKANPVYPAFAKAAGVEGIVRIGVGITQDGRIGALMERSGPPSLFKAAEDAVSQYVYRPFEKDGRPVYVQTTVSIVFRLSQHGNPLVPPHLSRTNFFGDDYHHPLAKLSPELERWLLSHRAPDRDGVCESSEGTACAGTRLTSPDEQQLKQIDVFDIMVPKGSHRLYVVRWHVECGGTGNCPEELLEQSDTGIRSVLTTVGSGYYVHQRGGASYPDIFVASHASSRQVAVAGYVNAGGVWGQLYCGEIAVNDDQSETAKIGFTCNQ